MTAPFTRWMIALALATLVMGCVLVHAAAAQEAVGQWHGMITSMESGEKLRVGVEIDRAPGGGLTGFITSPDQTAEQIPIEEISFDGGKLSFRSMAAMGGYQASWDAARGAWAGEWRQAGQVLPLVLEKGPIPAAAPARP